MWNNGWVRVRTWTATWASKKLHTYYCITIPAKMCTCPEHSPRSLSSDIHWWHSIQAVAAAVNEGAENYNAEDQDLHLDQFRKDSMHDPMGQLHDVYRQFEKDPKLQTDMDKTTITTTTATTASSSRHTHLVFSNAGKRSHVLRQEMRTPIPNNFGGMSVGREWKEAGEVCENKRYQILLTSQKVFHVDS